MAETTTAINACDAFISLEDQNGTQVAISGSSNAASLEFEQEIGEYRTFGGGWIRRLTCKKDATLSLSIVYTTDASEAMDLLLRWFKGQGAAKRRVVIKLPDENTANDEYAGDFVLENFSVPIDASEAGAIIVEASLMPDGEITHTVVAT